MLNFLRLLAPKQLAKFDAPLQPMTNLHLQEVLMANLQEVLMPFSL